MNVARYTIHYYHGEPKHILNRPDFVLIYVFPFSYFFSVLFLFFSFVPFLFTGPLRCGRPVSYFATDFYRWNGEGARSSLPVDHTQFQFFWFSVTVPFLYVCVCVSVLVCIFGQSSTRLMRCRNEIWAERKTLLSFWFFVSRLSISSNSVELSKMNSGGVWVNKIDGNKQARIYNSFFSGKQGRK